MSEKNNYLKAESTSKRFRIDKPAEVEWTATPIYKRKVLWFKQERNKYYAKKGETIFDKFWCKSVEMWLSEKAIQKKLFVWIKSKETIWGIGGKTKKSSVASAEESRGFGGRIWDPPVKQNKSAQWLGELETDLNGLKQQEY